MIRFRMKSICDYMWHVQQFRSSPNCMEFFAKGFKMPKNKSQGNECERTSTLTLQQSPCGLASISI